MNSNILNEYESDFFMLRTPSLSLSNLYDFHSSISSQQSNEVLFHNIRRVFSSSFTKEAIYVASPVLYRELLKILDASDYTNEFDKSLLSLYQYLNRMSSRCTPFGLFAGCTVGLTKGDKTNLKIQTAKSVQSHIRLDMDFLSKMANEIYLAHPKEIFSYVSNNTTYKMGKKRRLTETSFNESGKSYKITGVDNNPLLELVLDFCNEEKTYTKIIEFVKDLGVPETSAELYVKQLIDTQLLNHTLESNATGIEYMHRMVEILKNIEPLSEQYRILKSTVELLKNEGDLISRLKEIEGRLREIYPSLNEANLFQVDLNKEPIYCKLGNKELETIKEACIVNAKLNNIDHSKSKFTLFKKEFEKRYETELVKLTDALDPENGVNYQSLNPNAESIDALPFKNLESSFKLRKYHESIANQYAEIHIQESELVNFRIHHPLPDSFSAMVNVFKSTESDENHTIRFRHANGPTALNFLGRFAHTNSTVKKWVSKVARLEETLNKDKIVAEIAHIPQARVGNVIARPHTTKYEIQFLSNSDLPKRNRIYIEDLYLQLKNDQLRLFSKRLKKEVVPRLSNMHNFSHNNLQIYHFLCDFKSQGIQHHIGWNWSLLSEQEFLPRVKYKNIILSPRIWNLNQTHLKFFNDNKSNYIDNLQKLKTDLQIPDIVVYVEGDNELLLNLNVPTSLEVLKKAFKKRSKLKLTEPLCDFNQNIVKDENNAIYANELIIPFYKKAVQPDSNVNIPIFNKTKRIFPVGSEWIYFDIYTGKNTADSILQNIVYPFASNIIEKGYIDKWFFIRYANPDFHLRVRFHVNKIKQFGKVTTAFSELLQPLVFSKEVVKYTLNPYNREIERYGDTTMELSETLFYIESKFTCIYLSKPENRNKQILYAISFINQFLTTFNLSLDEKYSFYKLNRNALANRFSIENNKTLKETLIKTSRDFKNETSLAVNDSNKFWADTEIPIILKNYLEEASPTINLLAKLIRLNNNLTLFSFLSSHIHMFVNRLLKEEAVLNELLIYELLERDANSQLARLKKAAKIDL